MMKIKVIVLSLFIICISCTSYAANPFSTIYRPTAAKDLQDHVIKEYGNNPFALRNIFGPGMKDFDKLAKLKSNKLYDEILNRLNEEYYPNYSAVWFWFINELVKMDNKELQGICE
jgi:hypothetical protein